GQRAHRHGRRPGVGGPHGRSRRAWRRGRRVLAQPGEGRRRRPRRRRQGTGAEDGADPPRPPRSAAPARRRRCRRGGAHPRRHERGAPVIGSLRGTLLDRDGPELLVEVGGIGYRLQVTPATAAGAGDVGAETFLHVHQQVREDAVTLYGFTTIEDRRVFEVLIGTHGVGPALG